MQWHERVGVAIAAAVGGLALYGLVVRPLFGLLMQFTSKPADNLSGTLAKEAEAASRFDSDGKGIVRLVVDGHVVRILGYLEPEEKAKGVTVATGDKLLVTDIDGRRNTCRVIRL